MSIISDIVNEYIKVKYLPEVSGKIYESFELMLVFGYNYFEDKYVDLVSNDYGVDSADRSDMFILLIKKDLLEIVTSHYITLDSEQDISLNELVELVQFLYLIQNLEHYDIVKYRVYSQDSAKNIVVDLIDRYSMLGSVRAMELIERVDDIFITGLQAFIKDSDTEEVVDLKHKRYVDRFFKFIGDTECIGRTLYNKGYTKVTLEEILDILTIDIPSYVDKGMILESGKTTLDVLSLIIITMDEYIAPLYKLKSNIRLLSNDPKNYTRLISIAEKIIIDFNSFVEAEEAKGKLNDN